MTKRLRSHNRNAALLKASGFEDAPALDPPRGFRETGWFLEAEDPETLGAVEQGDLPPIERSARHHVDRVAIDEEQRRAWSLDYDPEEES